MFARVTLLVVALTFGLTIGYSRVFLGVHSWNQTLFGWQLGAWLALTLHLCFRDRIVANLYGLFDQSERDFCKNTLRWLALLFAIVLVETINYVVEDSQIVNDPVWSSNIAIKCPKENLDHAFEARSMLDNGIIGIGFGSYLGVVYSAKRHPGMMLRELTPEANTWTKRFLRVVFGIVICIPILCLLLLKSHHISNVYALALLKTFTPMFVSGFICFGVVDELCEKIGLLSFINNDKEEVKQNRIEDLRQ